jgi:hypothetical protein
MRNAAHALVLLVSWLLLPGLAPAQEPIDLGSRLEPLVDRFLIDRLQGDAQLQLHKPTPQDVVLVADKPWEGNTSAYFAIFQDGPRYRMYYRGSHFDEQTRKAPHREVTCYAESQDGIRWIKPKLGLFEFDGSKQNNIVWDGLGTHNFTPFLDANPQCPAEARYKALAVGSGGGKHGLYAFQSADGIQWKLMQSEPVITKGAFDSQNLAFWDRVRGIYAEYHRGFRDGVRDIMTGTSPDFLHWTDPVYLTYPDAPKEHLYTNAVRPYDRAPHILLGFPTRFLPKTEQVEPTFMTSRDGRVFQRWTEALIPITAPQDRDGNRSNYMASGLLRLPEEDKSYSVYGTEAYYRGPASRLRRFTYRVDGFVSAHATQGGELMTKPLRFRGSRLVLNYLTTAEGALRVEIQDAAGTPLDGFRLADCPPLRGDTLEQTVAWTGGQDLARLAGQPVRLRFELRQADLFALRFAPR